VRIRLRFNGLLETQPGARTWEQPWEKARRLGVMECFPDALRKEFVACPVGASYWNVEERPNILAGGDAGFAPRLTFNVIASHFTDAALAAASSFNLSGPTSGYLRSSESKVWKTAATTTTREPFVVCYRQISRNSFLLIM
jgi:hypothetical protein